MPPGTGNNNNGTENSQEETELQEMFNNLSEQEREQFHQRNRTDSFVSNEDIDQLVNDLDAPSVEQMSNAPRVSSPPKVNPKPKVDPPKLTEEQQKKLEELKKRTGLIVNEAVGFERFTQQAAALGKLDTRGKKPDLSTFTDQEIADIFDCGRINATINGLGDVNLEHRFGALNLMEKGITSKRGPESIPKGPDIPPTREYLEDAINTWLEHENYAYNPRTILQAQLQVASSPGLVIGGKLGNAKSDYRDLQKAIKSSTGQEFHDEEIEKQLAQLGLADERFGLEEARLKEEGMSRAARQGIEFAAEMKLSPKDVAFEIGEIKRLDNTRQFDLSGANLSGLDLSQSDLTGLKVDAETLSRAAGLKTVKGVDHGVLSKAVALQSMDNQLKNLQLRKAQLETKPTIGDHFKAFFRHGTKGVKGEIDKLDIKIDATEIAIDDTKKGVSLEDRKLGMKQLKHNQQTMSNEMEKAHNVVFEHNVQNSWDAGGTTVSRESAEKASKKYKMLEPTKKDFAKAIKTQEKVLKVREALGPKPKVESQGNKKSVKI